MRRAFRTSGLRTAASVFLAMGAGALVACSAAEVPTSSPDRADVVAGTPSGTLLASIERSIVESEYEATASRAGLQAPNRQHGLRTFFAPEGIRVHDRMAIDTAPLLSMQLRAFGREGALLHVGPGDVSHAGNRVEIARPGVVEWYVNGAAGLEQGFDVAERPGGAGALLMELVLAGAAVRQTGDDTLGVTTDSGRELVYGKLVASDASGASLPARLLAASPQLIRLWIDDAGAAYPIVVDPLLTAVYDTGLSSAQSLANFGASAAGAGDVNGDGYDDVIVGAPFYDGGQADEGAAFVFLGSASGVASGDTLSAASRIESDQAGAFLGLGSAVSGAGDVNGDGYDDVIVGSLLFDGGQVDEGVALLFLGSATGIVANGTWANANARFQSDQPGARMGVSVAAAGDVNADGYDDVIIGADEYDAGQADEGAAFVFLGGAAGMPDGTPATAAARLESDAPGGRLGSSVSGAGDVDKDGYDDVIVGGELTGAALVFHGGASGVPSGSPATADTVLDLVGNSVRVSGAGDVDGDGYDDVVVGSPFYAAGQSLEGAAFVFHGSAVGIPDADPSTAHAMIQSDQASAFLGTSVSGAGDVDGDGYDEIVVGSNGFDPAGAAFLFLGSSTGIVTDGTPLDAVAVLVPPVGGSSMGDSVSGDFDSNGDGYADSIVGDRQWGAGNEGAAFVYHGSSPAASATAVAPVSVLTTSEWTGTPAPAARKGNLINGSGLSGIGPVRMQTHSNAGGTFWHAGQGDGGLGGPVGAPPAVDTQAAVFDLGGWMDLEGTFIWNHNQYSWFARGVKELEILVSGETDPLTATFVSVGVFELASGDGLSPEPAQFRAFTAEHVRLVRFEFHSTHSGAANEWVGLSEVRFAAAPVAMRWAEIGDPGNACDTQADGCFGAVAEAFRMSQFEVTNAQYAQFLNAVAATDTNALYHVNMGTSAGVTNTTWVGGITRTGSAGSYTYAPIPGKEDWPVNYVSFWDAARFANWLHNGQPTGAQDDTTTEDGAYALTPAAIAAGTVTRNPGALAFVPSEDEWFKAAYYDPATSGYFAYPAGADPQTACTAPGVTANAANCFSAAGGVLTSVGSYPGSPSPNGTYDQGGSIEEWNEATQDGFGYVQRGGQFESSPVILAASWRWLRSPTLEFNNTGFRVASPIPVPEPGLVLGLGTGIACLSLLARRRRICAGVG